MKTDSSPSTPPEGQTPELGGLNPRDLLAGGLQSVAQPQGWRPPEPEQLARLLPQYQIEALIGRGGMGAVYRGKQGALDRSIAIKLLPAELTADAEFVGRFQREARTLARMQHPGIVAIYDFGQTSEGHLYFVMEFVDGTDLHRVIHGPGLNPPQVLEIIAQVCEALQYAHTHGVMHRDIKPANVLLTLDGRAKLADFGLARPTHDDTVGFTRNSVVMGTPDYIAPEQMYGQADHRADLFSLGVMLYEMLTGQTPRGAWAPPSQRVRVDVRLDQVVIRALQQDVALRYQQASEMKTDVDTIRTTPLPVASAPRKPQAAPPQKPAAAKPPPPAEKAPSRPTKKSGNAWALAVALPVLALGFGYWMMTQSKQPTTETAAFEPPAQVAKESPLVEKSTAAPPQSKTVPAAQPPKPRNEPAVASAPFDHSLPAGLKVPISESFQKARAAGGRLTFYKTKDLPAPHSQIFDLGEAAKFDDFVEVIIQSRAWYARRKNGEIWGKRWPANGSIIDVGPLQVGFMSRQSNNYWLIDSAGKVVQFIGPELQIDEPCPPGVASVIGNSAVKGKMMRLLLDPQGRTLHTRSDAGLTPPPADFFLNSRAATSTLDAYFAAEPGKPLRTWEAKTGAPIALTQPLPDEFVAMDAGGATALLLRADGAVISISEGRVNDRWNGAPADLGPAIQVRAGGSIHAAQKPDGTWAAWTPWTGDVHAELIRAAEALGPVIDMDSGAFIAPNSKSECILYIKPAGEPTIAAAAPAATAIPAAALAFGNSRYLLVQDKLNWNKADEAARAMSGHLLTITSDKEDQWIRDTFGDHIKSANLWLGATCKEHIKGAAWTWTTNEAWTYSNWAQNQPDFGYGGDGHPIYKLWTDELKWDDGAHNGTLSFVVEWDVPGGSSSIAVAASAPASTPVDDLTARLTDIAAKFQAAYDRDIAPPHRATVATLDGNYLAAVNRALAAATKRADLDEAVQLRAEAKRVTDQQPLPAEDAESAPTILKTLRATYRATLATLEKERDAKAEPYYARYDGLLEAYQKELTQLGRLDDALKVKTRRDELRNAPSAAVVQSAAPPSAPASPAQASGPVEIPKGASQETVIDWVFKYEGEVIVISGKNPINAKSRQELPNKPYELMEININGPGLTEKEFAQVAAVPGLKVIRFYRGTEITTLKPLTGLNELRILWLQNSSFKEAEMRHLAGLTKLELLYLQLKDGTGEGVAHLRGLTNLTTLTLREGSLSMAGAQAIAALPQLKHLYLHNFLPPKSQKNLAPLGTLPNLTDLALTKSRVALEAFTVIAGLKKLSTLSLTDSDINNRGFALLAPLAATLTALDMQTGATVSDEGLKDIATHLPNIETITVSFGSTCTVAGLRELIRLPKLKNISWWVKDMKDKDYQVLAELPVIERITLNGTAITDDGLSAFPKCTKLKYLNLTGNAITDKAFDHLLAIKPLQLVDLKSTKVTTAGVTAFKKVRPYTAIVH